MSGRLRLPVLAVWQVVMISVCLLPPPAPAIDGQAALFAPDGYRIDDFRSPVPEQVPGAHTVDTMQLRQLLDTRRPAPLLVDVLPSPPRPAGLNPAALWLPPTRLNIPGSTWLPNVGYGRLSDALDQYFRANLERLSGGDHTRPLVIYCLADCWMSWNAARRAAEYGYSQVLWYPQGTDGWQAEGLPLAKATAVPMP